MINCLSGNCRYCAARPESRDPGLQQAPLPPWPCQVARPYMTTTPLQALVSTCRYICTIETLASLLPISSPSPPSLLQLPGWEQMPSDE